MMRKAITTLVGLASVCATTVNGQVDNCVELLRLSRTTSRTVEDQEQFRSTVNNFCNEVRSARSEKRSLNVDLRVMGLGEGGGAEASTNSLYTRYCSGETDVNYDRRIYRQYLEGIAPGAYAAYDACTTAASNDVQFQMLTSPTRDVLELVVFHETNTPGGRADMSWSASDPVTCNWESFRGDGEVEAPQRRILAENERTRLKCRRGSFNAQPIREPDFVNVIRNGGNATINIPWRKYGPDNTPVQTIEEIRRNLEQEVDALRATHREVAERLQVLMSRQWRDVGRSRSEDQCYVNDTQYPMEIAVTTVNDGGRGFCRLDVVVDGQTILAGLSMSSGSSRRCASTATIPPGSEYRIEADGPNQGQIATWWELRAPVGDVQVVDCR